MDGAVVLYDEDCGFCRWAADLLRRWDRRGALTFQPIQDAERDEPLALLDVRARYDSWHVIEPDGRLWSSGAAISRVLRRLPGGRPLAAIADASPASTERAYRSVARHRTLLGNALGQQACAVDPSRAGAGIPNG